MKTRSQKKNIIPRVYTKSVISLNYAKCEDTKNAIKNLINDAKTNLNTSNCVIISLVIPDSYYKGDKNKKNKYIHQGHTFAVTIDNENLLLYDNSYKDPYYSKKKYWKNYQFVIDQLKEHRKIIFFPLNYAKKHKFKSLLNEEEGICFEYIKELEENNIILPPKYCFKNINH